MKKLLNKYIEYLEIEKNYSPLTILNYEYDIKGFIEYLTSESIHRFDEVTYPVSRSYLLKLFNEGLKKTSINRKISSVRSFYKYLEDENVVLSNPFLLLASPKHEKILPKFLFKEEVDKLLSVTIEDPYLSERNTMVIELLYATGIRVSELRNLKLQDINFSSKEIKVLGKGNKERLVRFGKAAKQLLSDYINNSRMELDKKNSDYLLLTSKGNKVNDRSIREMITKYGRLAHIDRPISPHVFRHTFATDLLSNGADLMTVKELLGHESLKATQIYTHMTSGKMRQSYDNAHPRARKKD